MSRYKCKYAQDKLKIIGEEWQIYLYQVFRILVLAEISNCSHSRSRNIRNVIFSDFQELTRRYFEHSIPYWFSSWQMPQKDYFTNKQIWDIQLSDCKCYLCYRSSHILIESQNLLIFQVSKLCWKYCSSLWNTKIYML